MALQPQISSYTKSSSKVWFTYVENVDRFQHGLLGITDSYVAGNLYLQFPEEKPLKAKRIEVSITGTEYVHWSEQKSRGVHRSGKWETESYAEHYRHKEEILNQSLLLWESGTLKNNIKSKKELYEKITNMNFPFRLLLPNDLPPSMNLGIGSIYYRVNAKIRRKHNFWRCQGSKKLVTCECYITRYSPMQKPAPIRWNEWDDSKARNRGLGYDISMIYDTYGPITLIVLDFADFDIACGTSCSFARDYFTAMVLLQNRYHLSHAIYFLYVARHVQVKYIIWLFDQLSCTKFLDVDKLKLFFKLSLSV